MGLSHRGRGNVGWPHSQAGQEVPVGLGGGLTVWNQGELLLRGSARSASVRIRQWVLPAPMETTMSTAIDTPNGDHQRSNSNPSTPKATLPSIIPTTVHAMAALDREGTKIDRVPQCRHRKRRMRNCALRNDSGWVQLGQEKDTMSSAYFHPGCTRQTMEPTTGSLHRMR